MGIFPTSTTQEKVIDNYWAPEMTPSAPLPVYLTLVAISGRNCVSVPSTALLPVYLALVAISRRNCVNIPSNQQVVVDASAQLSESVTKSKNS